MKDIFLLDIDETLFDFPREEREALWRTLKKRGAEPTEEMLARYHAINESYWKKLERGEIARARLVVERFEVFLREYGRADSPEEFSKEYFSELASGGKFYEGAEAFVKALKNKGRIFKALKNRGRIFLVTNGAQFTQTRRIAASGLGAYADGTFISEAIGINKPSKEYAAYVEAHIEGYERSRAVWVGDSLTSDAPCAASLGIDFILYRPQGAPEGYKGLCAQSYDEALELIGKM